jgi:hypothetical protein
MCLECCNQTQTRSKTAYVNLVRLVGKFSGVVPGSMGWAGFDTAWNDTAFSFSVRRAFTIL